jgi:hypothetical protein
MITIIELLFRIWIYFSPFTTKFVEPVQIPQLVEPIDEYHRLSIMRSAMAVDVPVRYPNEIKIGSTDLLNLIQVRLRRISLKCEGKKYKGF